MRISGQWLLFPGVIAVLLLSGPSWAQNQNPDYNPLNPGEAGSPPGTGCQIGTSGCFPSAPPGPVSEPADRGGTTMLPPDSVKTDDVPFYGRLPAAPESVPPVVHSYEEQWRQAVEESRQQTEQYRQQQQQLLNQIEQQQKLLDGQQQQLQNQQKQLEELLQRERQAEELRQKMQEKPAQAAGTKTAGNQPPGAQQPAQPGQTPPASPTSTTPQQQR